MQHGAMPMPPGSVAKLVKPTLLSVLTTSANYNFLKILDLQGVATVRSVRHGAAW